MGMDLLAVNPTAEARRFEVDGVNWCTPTRLGIACAVFAPGGYNMPPDGPLRAQIEHRTGAVIPNRFTTSGWFRFLDLLEAWGIETSSFPRSNDGHVISEAKCRQVAALLSTRIGEYADAFWEGDLAKAEADIDGWRTCGGYAVW